jgi:hypothetical protein
MALPGLEFSPGLLDLLGEKISPAFSDPMAEHSDQLRLNSLGSSPGSAGVAVAV